MNDLISIIIPTYNSEKYIVRCLNSLFKQNYSNIEIIVVDNYSTDNTIPLIKKYYKGIHVIKLFFQKIKGPSFSRNYGLEQATGKYVFFLDSDDWLSDNALESLIKNYKSEYLNGLKLRKVCDAKKESYLHTINVNSDLINNIVFGNIGGFTCGYLFEYKKLENLKFDTNTSYMEDMLFLVEYSKKVNGINYVDNFYNYYQSDNSITNNTSLIKQNIISMNYVLDLLEVNNGLDLQKLLRKKIKIIDSSLAKIANISELKGVLDTDIVKVIYKILYAYKGNIIIKFYLNSLIKKNMYVLKIYYDSRKILKNIREKI